MTAPNPILSSGRRPYLAGGMRYDGATKDWQLDGHGQIRGVHWVDSGMAMSLVDAGSIPCSPTTGNRIREKLAYLGGPDTQAVVESCVMSAQPLARYVAAGHVTINRVASETRNSRLAYVIYYTNNLETSPRSATSARELVWYT